MICAGEMLQLKRIYGINCDSRLDLPDTTSQQLSSSFKLRRVASCSSIFGSNWRENPIFFGQDISVGGGGLKRVHHSA